MTDLFSQPTFEDIYAAFPRKVGKKCAQTACKTALKEISPTALLKAVEAFAAITHEQTGYQNKRGKDKIEALKYVVHPKTWLNQGRWEDEVITEWLERPEEIPLITLKAGEPGYSEWIDRKCAESPNPYARDFLEKQPFIAVPSPFPPETE